MIANIIEIYFRSARDAMNQHLEKLFGTTEVPFEQQPILEVKLVNIIPEAFEMVLHYIYTDRIDCKQILFQSKTFLF